MFWTIQMSYSCWWFMCPEGSPMLLMNYVSWGVSHGCWWLMCPEGSPMLLMAYVSWGVSHGCCWLMCPEGFPMVVDGLCVLRGFPWLSEPLLDWHTLVFTGKCFACTGKNVTGTKYGLNWALFVTCWRYSVSWVQKHMEAPTKQDRFRCWSASKTMNADTRCCMRHMLEVKTFTENTPPASLNGQVLKYECWQQDTRPFHFRLDKSALLCDFFLLHFHSKSDCIDMAQWNVQSFFVFAQCQPNHLYHCQMKEPLKWLRNHQTTIYLATDNKRVQKCFDDRFSVAQAWRWCWHWKVWCLSVTIILQTVLRQGGDLSDEIEILF